MEANSKMKRNAMPITCLLLILMMSVISGCFGGENVGQGDSAEPNKQSEAVTANDKHENIQYSDKHSIICHDEKYYFDGDQNKLVIFYTNYACSYLGLKSIKKDWDRGDRKEFRYAVTIGSYRKDTDTTTEKLFYIMMKSPGYRGGAVPEFVQYSTDKHKWTTISADNPEQTAICIYAAGKEIAEREHLENIIKLFRADEKK